MTDFGSDPFSTGRKPDRFALMRLSAIEFDTSPRWLIEDLIPRNGIVLVWGPPKCGKTFWAFDLVGHIALGRDYYDHAVELGRVVYIACEGEYGVKTRAVAFREERVNSADPPLYLMTTRLDLISDIDELVAAIASQIDGEGASAIVLDTLNRSFVGSEAKDEDMSAYVAAADRLRAEFHCVVIIVHHCGVAETRPRGHTSLTGAVDAQIAVKRDVDGTILVHFELMKDGPEGQMLRCRLKSVEVGTDARGKPVTSCVVEHLDAPAADDEHKQQKKLTAAQKIALKVLYNAISTEGVGEIPPPDPSHIPPNTYCIREEVWRQYCYKGGISAGETQEAKRKAYTGVRDTLIANGMVGSWDGWVWPVQC
jgi:hypothetical protein